MANWWIGVVLNLLGSISINLGTNVVKLSHNRNQALPEDKRVPAHSMLEWRVGTGVFVLGNILNFVSFGYAAQSLLAALGSVQFISNVVFATVILSEKPTLRVLAGTALIILGNTLAVVFATHESTTPDAHELFDRYGSLPFTMYLVLIVSMAILARFVYAHIESDSAPSPGLQKLLPVCYAAMYAPICAMSVLFAKSLSVLLLLSFKGDNQFVNPFTYCLLVLFLVLTVVWMKKLNGALQLFDALVIVPVLQVFWTVSSILSGGLYFGEFAAMPAKQASVFFLGVGIILLGVVVLSSSDTSDDQEVEESAEDQQKDKVVEEVVTRQRAYTALGTLVVDMIIHDYDGGPGGAGAGGGGGGAGAGAGGGDYARIFDMDPVEYEDGAAAFPTTVDDEGYRRWWGWTQNKFHQLMQLVPRGSKGPTKVRLPLRETISRRPRRNLFWLGTDDFEELVA